MLLQRHILSSHLLLSHGTFAAGYSELQPTGRVRLWSLSEMSRVDDESRVAPLEEIVPFSRRPAARPHDMAIFLG